MAGLHPLIGSGSQWQTALLPMLTIMIAGCGGDEAPTSSAANRAKQALYPTPQRVLHHCRALAAPRQVAVLCPRQLPPGRWIVAHQSMEPGRCAYLLDLDTNPRTSPFHTLVGGRCDEWTLRIRPGRWPVKVPMADGLSLVGQTALKPGQTWRDQQYVRPRVVRRVRVAGHPGLLLAIAPYPDGGLHGGHLVAIWNQNDSGYALSVHHESNDGTMASDREATILRLADGMSRS